MKRILFVIGMHRSGTSMVSNMMVDQGYFPGDELYPKAYDNLLGYYEDKEIVRINLEIMRSSKIKEMDLTTEDYLPLDDISERLPDIDERIKSYTSKSFEQSDKILIKDPRTCLTLPVWINSLSEYDVKYVYIFRDPIEVASSMIRRGNCKELSEGYIVWKNYNESALKYVSEENTTFVSYNEILNSPLKAMLPVFNFLKIKETPENLSKIYGVVNANLRNENSSGKKNDLPQDVSDLYKSLLKKTEERSKTPVTSIDDPDQLITLSISEKQKNMKEVNEELGRQKKRYLSETKDYRKQIAKLKKEKKRLKKEIKNMNKEINSYIQQIAENDLAISKYEEELNSFTVRNVVNIRNKLNSFGFTRIILRIVKGEKGS